MPWFDELFGGLDGDEIVDTTVYRRELPEGRGNRTDYSMTERTRFRNGYPEVEKEMRWAAPLSCGHIVAQNQNPFGGYCQATVHRENRCLNEVCAQCGFNCPECGRYTGLHCHSDDFDGIRVCTACKRRLRRRHLLRSTWQLFTRPFTSEDDDEDDW